MSPVTIQQANPAMTAVYILDRPEKACWRGLGVKFDLIVARSKPVRNKPNPVTMDHGGMVEAGGMKEEAGSGSGCCFWTLRVASLEALAVPVICGYRWLADVKPGKQRWQ